jgi:hypothetical protein
MPTQPPTPPADNNERAYQSYGAVTRMGVCPVCGRERPLDTDGTLVDHDHLITDHAGKYRQRCAGSGRFPELDK